jgi:ABC-type Fe3+-siderophore transport system permease subunit
VIALASILFYPFALGLTMFDPYSWGYGSIIFVVAVMMMALLFFFTKRSWEALMISLAVIAWSIHWHESTNLWDYLLDPFLAVWAIIVSIRWIVWGRQEPHTYSAWDIDSSVLARRKQGKFFS